MAFLLKHDSVGGTLPNDVKATDDGFSIDGREIRKLEVMDPAEIPWSDHDVDVVIESTGLFTAREKAAGHLGGSVERVIISAPSGDADATICMGVNDAVYDAAQHTVISNASCTTNCLAPMAKVLNDALRHRAGPHDDGARVHERPVAAGPRQGRPAGASPTCAACAPPALSIIPSSTGAAKAIGLVLPELKGKLNGTSLRVPDADRLDHRPVGEPRPRGHRRRRSTPRSPRPPNDTSYRGVLEYSDEPLVSADIVGNPSSCIFSAEDTMADGKMVKVLGWYDNEWGYSNRLVDLVAFVGGVVRPTVGDPMDLPRPRGPAA